jgi:hypothetical protein
MALILSKTNDGIVVNRVSCSDSLFPPSNRMLNLLFCLSVLFARMYCIVSCIVP